MLFLATTLLGLKSYVCATNVIAAQKMDEQSMSSQIDILPMMCTKVVEEGRGDW